MKKVIVDESKCIRCGACMGIAEDVFKSGPDGESVPKVDTVADDNNEAVLAMESCPTGAIRLEEVDGCECDPCECGNCDCGDSCDCEDCDCEDCECGSCDCADE